MVLRLWTELHPLIGSRRSVIGTAAVRTVSGGNSWSLNVHLPPLASLGSSCQYLAPLNLLFRTQFSVLDNNYVNSFILWWGGQYLSCLHISCDGHGDRISVYRLAAWNRYRHGWNTTSHVECNGYFRNLYVPVVITLHLSQFVSSVEKQVAPVWRLHDQLSVRTKVNIPKLL